MAVKLVCPRCGARARTLYIQSSGPTRSMSSIVNFAWCHAEKVPVPMLPTVDPPPEPTIPGETVDPSRGSRFEFDVFLGEARKPITFGSRPPVISFDDPMIRFPRDPSTSGSVTSAFTVKSLSAYSLHGEKGTRTVTLTAEHGDPIPTAAPDPYQSQEGSLTINGREFLVYMRTGFSWPIAAYAVDRIVSVVES